MSRIYNRGSINRSVSMLLVIFLGLLVISQAVVVEEADSKGVNVEAVEKRGVRIWTRQGCDSTYELGTLLNIRVKAKRSGYLTVFDLMPNGEVQILFPNRFQQNNYIQGGKVYKLPAREDPFRLRISCPKGLDQLLAVVTEKKKKLVREDFSHYSQNFPKLRDSKGEVVEQVKKGVNVIPAEDWWAADSCSFYVGAPGQYQYQDEDETEQPPVEPDQEVQPDDGTENTISGKIQGRVLIIGIADYINTSFEHMGQEYKFKDLNYSVNDARDMKDLLEQKYTRVRTLINEDATYQKIKEGVKNWLGAVGKNEVAVLYFSGHGAFQPDMNGDETDGFDEVLVPYGYSKAGKFIVDDQINEWLSGLISEKVVYIADSCHAGTSSKAVRSFTTQATTKSAGNILGDSIGEDLTKTEGANVKGGSGKKIVALEASKPSQSAIEDEELRQGVFTYFLMQGLKGDADKDGNDRISLEEVYEYSEQKVIQYTNSQQEPICSGCDKTNVYLSIVK